MNWSLRRNRPPGTVPFLLAALSVTSGCTGAITGAGEEPEVGTGTKPASPGAPKKPGATMTPPGASLPTSTVGTDGFRIECAGNKSCEGEASPLRRLTNREYLNTVRDLLGIASDPTAAFAEDSVVDGFRNNARTQTATEPIAKQYFMAARALSEEVLPGIRALSGCDSGAREEAACAQAFVETFGKRAYRRPLLEAEKGIATRLYGRVREAGASHDEGLATVLQFFLTSPQFLYRLELTGRDGMGKPGQLLRLDDWEMASRLSYLFWESMPDAELMTAAEQGKLRTNDQIATQARRLLTSPRGRAVVRHFFAEWLDLQHFEGVEKDEKAFPEFTPAIKAALLKEIEAFLDHAFWQKKGDVKALIAGPFTFRNAALKAFYGDGMGGTGEALTEVDLSAKPRRGLLTLGGFAAMHATKEDSDPVKRGMFVRERLLCGFIPDPPNNAAAAPPPHLPGQTKREYFAVHTNTPGCDVCHKLMDPIGLGLENYDGVGRWRDTEKGKPIDTSGQWSKEDGGGSFRDSVGMLETLAQNPRVYDCVVKTWFRFAMGRSEIESDLPTLTQLYDNLRKSNDMHALISDLVQTATFNSRVVSN